MKKNNVLRNNRGAALVSIMIAVAFIGSILVPAFFVAINVMKERSSDYISRLRNKKQK